MDYIIKTSLTVLVNIVCMDLLLTRKRSIKSAFFIFIINYLTVRFGEVLAFVFLKGNIFYNHIFLILNFTYIIYIFLVYEESLSIKIFTFISLWLFSNMLLIECSYIVGLFNIKDTNTFRTFSMLLKEFIQILTMPIIYLYFQPKYKEMMRSVSSKVINIISLYNTIIFLFLANYYEFNTNKIITSYGLFNGMMLILIITLTYVIISIVISSVNQKIQSEYKYKLVDAQIELQKQNYKSLNQSIENYNAFKHDVRHHLIAIKLMIDAENYTAASEYMEKFCEIEGTQDIDVLCNNFTIDSILKYYMSNALNYNVDFKVNVNIPQDINIDNFDLAVVIGNCVENAIEACGKIIGKDKKYIDIKAEIKGFNLILIIKNSFNGHVIKEGNIIKTSKKSQKHGIGLSNVRKIAEKYNGFFDVKYTDSEFEVSIIMNFNNISQEKPHASLSYGKLLQTDTKYPS